MITAERALHRIQEADRGLFDYKQKVYRLRRLVAGDADALEDGNAPSNNSDNAGDVARMFRANWRDILVQQVEEGRDNGLLKFLWVLASITCYSFPKIEIQGIHAQEQVVNAQYVKSRMREHPFGCNAIQHARMALLDYLMGGLGAVYLPSGDDGKPLVQWADSLDLKWDQVARLACDVKWMSITRVESMSTWIEMFGEAAFEQWIGPADPERVAWDMPIELEFYYDLDVEKGKKGQIKTNGNYKVFMKMDDQAYQPKPILELENPNYYDFEGTKIPFLPFPTIFYSTLPSVRLPSGVAEKMLPSQIAVWAGMERLQQIIDSGVSFWEIPEGVWADEEAREVFLQAMQTGIVTVREDKFGKMKLHVAEEVSTGLREYIAEHQRSMQSQSGASSSSVGEATPGIKFAAEQYDIRAQSGLMTASIGKDNADFWERIVRMFLAKGALYDQAGFKCLIDGVYLHFGKGQELGHVADYLRPDAEIFVSEDGMRFSPPGQRIAMASQILDRALQLAQQFPNAVQPAYRAFLEACGVDNPEERLQQPAPVAQPGMPQGAPGMAPPGAAPGAQQGAAGLQAQTA